MKRIAHIADSHFDTSSRFEECVRLHNWIADDLERQRPNLILHGGDVFERKSNPDERNAVAALLTRLGKIAPVVIVRGNHDAVGDLALFARLKTDHPIVVVETASVVYAADCAIACLAWPRRAELLARAGGDVGNEAGNQLAAEALRNVLRGMGDQMGSHYGPRILLAHAMVRGSVTSTGQPLVGCDMELGLEDLGLAGADFVALGHIHKGQDWSWGGAPIVYPGSPRRTAFGELEAKGYVMVEIAASGTTDKAAVRWEFVAAPATRMILADDEWGVETFSDGSIGWLVGWHGLDAEAVHGAEVRLRYTVDADRREAAKSAAEQARADVLARGAASVKLEERVRATTRARTPEIVTAATLEEKLDVLWRSKQIDVTAERRARVLGRLAELEAA